MPSASISGAVSLHCPTTKVLLTAVRYLLCVFHSAPRCKASALDFCGCPQPAVERHGTRRHSLSHQNHSQVRSTRNRG